MEVAGRRVWVTPSEGSCAPSLKQAVESDSPTVMTTIQTLGKPKKRGTACVRNYGSNLTVAAFMCWG